MARSYVARELVKLGGRPDWRQGYVTDNGNHILDVHACGFWIHRHGTGNQPDRRCGLCRYFARRTADVLLVGYQDRVEK